VLAASADLGRLVAISSTDNGLALRDLGATANYWYASRALSNGVSSVFRDLYPDGGLRQMIPTLGGDLIPGSLLIPHGDPACCYGPSQVALAANRVFAYAPGPSGPCAPTGGIAYADLTLSGASVACALPLASWPGYGFGAGPLVSTGADIFWMTSTNTVNLETGPTYAPAGHASLVLSGATVNSPSGGPHIVDNSFVHPQFVPFSLSSGERLVAFGSGTGGGINQQLSIVGVTGANTLVQHGPYAVFNDGSPLNVVAAQLSRSGPASGVLAFSDQSNEIRVLTVDTASGFNVVTKASITNGIAGFDAFALADLNADGLNDLVFTAGKGSAVEALYGEGDGRFGAVSRFRASPLLQVAADLDGDGLSELLVRGNNVFEGLWGTTGGVALGAGSVPTTTATYSTIGVSEPAAAGFYGRSSDGYLVRFSASPKSDRLTTETRVLTTNGAPISSSYVESKWQHGSTAYLRTTDETVFALGPSGATLFHPATAPTGSVVVLVDFDSDGDPDLFSLNIEGASYVPRWLQNDGQFSGAWQTLPYGPTGNALVRRRNLIADDGAVVATLGPFDGANTDVRIGRYTPTSLTVSPGPPALDYPGYAALGQVTTDVHADLVTWGSDNKIYLFAGHADGTYSLLQTMVQTGAFLGLTPIVTQGRADLLIQTGRDFIVLRNAGDAGFQ
jgi:hypothetical protein